MRNLPCVFCLALFLTIAVENPACFGKLLEEQFPLGTIGCLFTRNICDPGTKCIDDFLFGTCKGPGISARDEFMYEFGLEELALLESELVSLIKYGLSWKDPYTQCILQNALVSLSLRIPFKRKECVGLLLSWDNTVESDISSALAGLYKNTLDNFNPPSEYEQAAPFSKSSKRDEIVRVHKYYDKSKGIHKRRFSGDSVRNKNYLSYYPRDDLLNFDPRSVPSSQQQDWENSGIPLSDLLLVQEYLDATKNEDSKPEFGEQLEDLFDEGQDQSLLPGAIGTENLDTFKSYPSEDEFKPGYSWTDGGDIYKISPTEADELDEVGVLGDSSEDEGENLLLEPLPPPYANLLGKLIEGDTEPDNLTDEELDFLTKYVSAMLTRLDAADEDGVEGRIDELSMTPQIESALESEMMGEAINSDDLPQDDVIAEQMTFTSDDNDLDAGSDYPVLEKKADAAPLKGVESAEDGGQKDIVNINYAFVIVENNLDDASAEKLVSELHKVTTANPGSLDNYKYRDNKLTIKVDPVLAGINASILATQARDHQVDLEKATGLKILKTGIGSENEVEIKSTDDSYFVLTFVLCGCIAGILLAVVIIYLIRRNTRSKEKLAQIASVGEGNEASNDYQDLCRQRMQSKSSEKPEPLHAASRVGSVSESQVRSPSSRSSTSSWSEEPVNSNMDISTGHIVLSYMEDHLKNKGRLEQEWDGLCAYEADPSSTKVAEDSSNARKNRYSDILPYDHSRVVLSSRTNVSGSDFINASTITDHDPRNPAYIATQGPLPHTVADFWQMVWEQGSVVMVMLSKLTENGEAMCHRYWPEEGSDLYHVYEVHLVSEHIWCDDYLVRSFYLKNLQTNETRTVTQFHFLTWPDLGVPSSIKALLDFRRKVNKSYRGRSCPIVVHCSDGCGRTGTYCLVDMVLNRMAKGAKEIDIAATLEHIRDQRMNMVKTKEQFQFALAAVAEEVHAILKALPQ